MIIKTNLGYRMHSAMQMACKDISDKISDDVSIIELKEGSVGEGDVLVYNLHGKISSSKIWHYWINWRPSEKLFLCTGISVDPKFRHRGIGTLLIDYAEKIAEELNCEEIIMCNIVDERMPYWKQRKDYVIKDRSAHKNISSN